MTSNDEDNPELPKPPEVPELSKPKPAKAHTDFDFTIADDDQLPPMPDGVPSDFWSRLSVALKSRDADVLAAAAESYCGTFPSAHEYICSTVSFELPGHLDWLAPLMVAHVDPDRMREAYERGKVVLWEVEASPGLMMIFESSRIGKRPFSVPRKGEWLVVYREPTNA